MQRITNRPTGQVFNERYFPLKGVACLCRQVHIDCLEQIKNCDIHNCKPTPTSHRPQAYTLSARLTESQNGYLGSFSYRWPFSLPPVSRHFLVHVKNLRILTYLILTCVHQRTLGSNFRSCRQGNQSCRTANLCKHNQYYVITQSCKILFSEEEAESTDKNLVKVFLLSRVCAASRKK